MGTVKQLQYVFIAQMVVFGLIAILGETGVLPASNLAADDGKVYMLSMVGVVFALMYIPLALKLMHIARVRREIKGNEKKYFSWYLVRFTLLCIAVLFNLVMYYLLDFNTTCGYLALMTLVAYIFVWPSRARMENECEITYDQE